MHVQPEPVRFQAESTTEGLRVVIPVIRNWGTLLFILAWLGGWTIGETNVGGQLFGPDGKTPSLFLVFWLVCWTIAGLFAFGTVLWQLAGREILTANSSALVHRVEVFGVGVSRSYGAAHIKNLRAFGSGHGHIAFDYGAKTIRIGSSLEEAEARAVVHRLLPHLPDQA